MNLADSFEPQAPPEHGLQHVRRRARVRALQRQVSTGTAMLLPFIVGGGLYLANGFNDNGSSSPYTQGASSDGGGGVGPASISKQTIDGLNGNITPDAQGLPGSSVSATYINGIAYYGDILAAIFIFVVVIASIVRTARSDEPVAWFSKPARWVLAISFLWILTTLIIGWFFSPGHSVT